MMASKECSEVIARHARHARDEACGMFIEAWNTQSQEVAALKDEIAELELRVEKLVAKLDERDRKIAEVEAAFSMLADMMRRER